tara:strand:- start:62 stop:709 length:648 start_codon:yes stop_codon:yes gene_type:complete
MKNLKTLIVMCFTFLFISIQNVEAQDFGADVVSSYVWRGTQFGQGPHIQPYVSAGKGGFEIGLWGSFPTTAGGGGNELDAYLSYDFGPLALTVTNYTFPNGNGTYSSGSFFDGDIEVSASADIGNLSILGGYFPDLETLYIEAGYSFGDVDFALGFGSDSKDAFYVGDGESDIVNVSFGYSKEIKITEDYSLPVFSSFVYNPSAEAAFLVFGLSF